MRRAIVAVLLFSVLTERAEAWSRPAHMVTAAIAYAELDDDPALKAAILDLLEAHPDRAPFEVAIDRTTGEARARRLFYECARWPDDARGTAYDHPTWHYAARPVVTVDAPKKPADTIDGNAIEAFALNVRVLGDRRASKAERAVALCWVMHLVGDIHQPLHTAQLFSKEFPEGDQLGSKQFVRETASGEAVSLHWFWDDSVHRSGTQESVEERASELSRRTPKPQPAATADDFARWAQEESYPAAVSLVYRADLIYAPQSADARALQQTYISDVRALADHRVALAGHRLADILRAAWRAARPVP